MARRKSGTTFLPDYLVPAHNLCFLHHDVLVELLRSGEEVGSFDQTFELHDEADRQAFERAVDVFEWMENTKRKGERVALLRRTVFPAVLSDFLLFVYEALETSRKAKLNVSYALLRKPLQESLFLLETIATDADRFASHLMLDPLQLRAQKAGGLDAHTKRIAAVLCALEDGDRFDPAYLAQLRYDKMSEDGFDGLCNLAVHLFTEHKAIRTESLNINFVFSGWDDKLSQWHFLYSRLPYLLSYARSLVEHVYSSFEQTDPVYLADIGRRLSAGTLLWGAEIPDEYQNPMVQRFIDTTLAKLLTDCERNGYRRPTAADLVRMSGSGAWPGESWVRVRVRHAHYWFARRARGDRSG